MTEHPQAHISDRTNNTWQSPLPAEYPVSMTPVSIRGVQSRMCPCCGEPVGSDAKACEACGEELLHAPKLIRCAHCATQASSALTVCPGCGRELHEAPPRLLSYGAPALAAVVLFFLLSFAWTQLRPLNWARNNLVRGVTLVEDLGASLEPEVVIVMTPIVMTPVVEDASVVVEPVVVAQAEQDTGGAAAPTEPQVVALAAPVDPALAEAAQADAAALAVVTESSPVGVGGPSSTQTGAAEVPTPIVEIVPPSATSAPAEAPAMLPTSTDAPAEDAAGDETARPATEEAGQTPERTATATWTPLPGSESAALVVAAETPTPAAQENAQARMAQVAPEGGVAQAAGLDQVSTEATSTPQLPPALTPTPAPTLPPPTPTPVVYQVRTGDTLVSIAVQYNVTVEALMTANNISARDVYVIQPGQMLIIPQPEPSPVAAAAAAPATNIRLEAPVLLEPADGATVECETPSVVSWQRVQFVKDSDKYLLHLGFVSGPPNGDQETITWVLAQARPVTETSWEMDPSLCDLAPAEYDRQWRWWVEVIEENGAQVAVSPPSAVRRLRWD